MDGRRIAQWIFLGGIGLTAITTLFFFRRNHRSRGQPVSAVERENLSASIQGKIEDGKIEQVLDALTSVQSETDELFQSLRKKLDELISQIRTPSGSQ